MQFVRGEPNIGMSVAISSESTLSEADELIVDLFSEADFPNTTSTSEDTFTSKIELDVQLLRKKIAKCTQEVDNLTVQEREYNEEESKLNAKCDRLNEELMGYRHEMKELKEQIATPTTAEVEEVYERLKQVERRKVLANKQLEKLETNMDAASEQKQKLLKHIHGLSSKLETMMWLQGASWKLKPPPFTQTPEWDCLGRSKVECDIKSAVDATDGADPDDATRDSTKMVQIVSAPRQGKSLMLDRISRHYLDGGWAVVCVTFNGPRAIKVPDCPDGVSDDKHAIRELWSRVLFASFNGTQKKGYSLEECRTHVKNAHVTGGGALGKLLGSAFGRRRVLLLIDEISVLTDSLKLTPIFAQDLMSFLSPNHKLVYTTFDATMSTLYMTASGRVPVSFELPLLDTERQMRQLLPQKMALQIFCKKENLPFAFLYNMLKSSPGTLGAILDPEAFTVPIFELLASPASNDLWGACLRPYVEYSMVGTVTSKELKSDELFQLVLGSKLGIDEGRRVVPVFLAMFVLSRNEDCFTDDVWKRLYNVLKTFRTDCAKLSSESTDVNAKARGALFENYLKGSLLLRWACGGAKSSTMHSTILCETACCFSSPGQDDDFTHTTTPISGVTADCKFTFSYPCCSVKHVTHIQRENPHALTFPLPDEDASKVLELRKKTHTYYYPQGKSGNDETNKLLDGFYFAETHDDPNTLTEYWIQAKNRANCFGELSQDKGRNYSANFSFPEHVKSALENVDALNSKDTGLKVSRVVHVIVAPTVGSARRQIGETTQYQLILAELKTVLAGRASGCCEYELQVVSHDADEKKTFGTYAKLFSPVLAHFIPDSESFESGSWQAKYLCDVPTPTVPDHLAQSDSRKAWLAKVESAIGRSASKTDLLKLHLDVPGDAMDPDKPKEKAMVMKRLNVGDLSEEDANEYKTTLAKCVVARAYAVQQNLNVKDRIKRLLQRD